MLSVRNNLSKQTTGIWLMVELTFSSPYLCKYCLTILKKRHSVCLKLKDIDAELKNRYNGVSLLQVKSNYLEEPAVKIRLVGSSSVPRLSLSNMRSHKRINVILFLRVQTRTKRTYLFSRRLTH